MLSMQQGYIITDSNYVNSIRVEVNLKLRIYGAFLNSYYKFHKHLYLLYINYCALNIDIISRNLALFLWISNFYIANKD